MNEKDQKLQRILELAKIADALTATQAREYVDLLVKLTTKQKEALIEESKKLNSEFADAVSQETFRQIKEALGVISEKHHDALLEVRQLSNKKEKKIDEKLQKVEDLIIELQSIEVKDGKDADEEVIVEKVLSQIKLPEEVVLDTPEQIVDKLESLEGEDRLDAKAIKNLPKFIENKIGGVVSRNLYQLGDVKLTSLANNDTLKYNSTSGFWENGVGGGGATAFTDLTDVPASYTGQGGKAVRVNAGETGLEFFAASGSGTVTSVGVSVPTGLTVSGSPVTTAGTIALALDTGYVIPLQTTLDNKVPYTGATADLDLGTWDLLTDTVGASTSAGLLIESANGTDIGILGAGNTANVEWYGNHNFSLATQDTIAAFIGTGKTLSSLATATYPSLTELSYVKGVTSAIQTQLNSKGDFKLDQTTPQTVINGAPIFSGGLEIATGSLLLRNDSTASSQATQDSSANEVFRASGWASGAATTNEFRIRYNLPTNADISSSSNTGGLTIYQTATATGTEYELAKFLFNATPGLFGTSDLPAAARYSSMLKFPGIGVIGTGSSQDLIFVAGTTTIARLRPGIGNTFTDDILVPDEAYGAGWNASLEVPTKNAVYDKIETLQPLDAQLTDLAGLSYTGNALKVIRVNAGETGFELATVSGSGGITRSVNSISSPTTAGATALTDYVYFVSGTTTLTLPTAVGNTNKYTVKNTGIATVTVDTTSAQTIDGASTLTINTPYSYDIISDGSNWFIV